MTDGWRECNVRRRAIMSATVDPPDIVALSRRDFRIALSGLLMVLMLAALDQNIVSTALPRITSDLGGLAHLSWIVTGFMLASTATTPLYGKLSDIYGRRPLFIVAIVTFVVGSMLCGLADSMTQLILFRGLQGLGAGGLMALAQTTLGDLVSPRERGRYQGTFSAVFAVCSISGPLLGGFLTDVLSWRWIFYVNLPVGLAALALIMLGLKPTSRLIKHRIDYGGAVLLTAATSSLLLMLSWGGSTYPWGSPIIIGLGVAAAGLTVLLILQEASAREPMLPLRLFRNAVFVIAGSITGITATALFGAFVFMPTYFQIVLRVTPAMSGLLTAPLMGGLIAASYIGGRLLTRTGRYKALPVGGLLVSTLAFLLMTWAVSRDFMPAIEVTLVLLGACLGVVMPNLTVATQNAVARLDLGVATSTLSFFRSLGGAIGVAAAGTIMTIELNRQPETIRRVISQGIQQLAAQPLAVQQAVTEAYRDAIVASFLAGAAATGVAFLLVLLLPERPLK